MLGAGRENRGRYMAGAQEVRERAGEPDCEESQSDWSVHANAPETEWKWLLIVFV